MSAPELKHVVIVGAGAVGITLAAFLREAGHRVTFVVRRPGTPSLPVTIEDGINSVTRVLADVETLQLDAVLPAADHWVVCTRGDQLEQALRSLRARLAPQVPVTVAAATFEDLRALADRVGLPNPILRMGVGFGAWLVGPARYRLFALGRQGSAIACEVGAEGKSARDELAHLLRASSLPCQAAPTTAFRWLFRTILALEVPFLHAYRQAGWDMAELVRRPELLRLCGQGMHEAARSVRAEAGVIAMASALVPGGILARIARRRARRASADFREVWRHHGPKTEDQLRYLTAQLLDRAGSTPQRALGALSAT